jgi:hypothetical protein
LATNHQQLSDFGANDRDLAFHRRRQPIIILAVVNLAPTLVSILLLASSQVQKPDEFVARGVSKQRQTLSVKIVPLWNDVDIDSGPDFALSCLTSILTSSNIDPVMSAINSNWGWNKSWQRRQLRVPLNQRGGHLYPPILLASLNPTIHRPCENGRGVLYIALIHCPEIRNDDITISKFEGAASVRHKIAIRAMNLKSEERRDRKPIVVSPFFMASHATLARFAH